MIWLLLTWIFFPFLWLRQYCRRTSSRRVLVVQTAKIGDFVATSCVFKALRENLPDVEVVALVHPVNQLLARQQPNIDRVIVLPQAGLRGLYAKRWLYGVLQEGYDAVLLLSPNLSNLLLPFWVGIPKRVAVLADRRRGIVRFAWPLLSHGEAHLPGRQFRESALRALSGLGVQVDQKLLSTPNEILASQPGLLKLAAWRNSLPSGGVVGLGLGAGNRMKALSLVQLKLLSYAILDTTDAILILIGTEADKSIAISLQEELPTDRVFDTTGQWALDELPALLSALDVFVGVDSGATYLADSVGVPVIDYMGPADPLDQHPIGPQAEIIKSTESCAPCSHAFDAPYTCRFGSRACMQNAPLEAMANAVLARLPCR